MTALPLRRSLAAILALIGLCFACLATGARAATPTLDLENLSGYQEEQMLQSGQITSVQLVRAYLARISALNKSGPGLNAVTQINPDALKEAAQADYDRAHGIDLGPAMGLPILLKDIIDASPMYTSAGDWALRNSYAPDSGVAAELKAHGVVILGKTGLSEWANSFGSQPSGYSNLTGQVLSAIDTAEGPSGSSSGSGAAASAGLASLTIGTETSGSIISPSTMQADVGLRPTVGLVPGYGIAPIDASQDTAGPIVRDVSDAAITLQSIAEVPGSDPTANSEYSTVMGPNYLGGSPTLAPNASGGVTFPGGKLADVPAAPSSWSGQLPDYSAALTTGFVKGKSIGYNATCTGYTLSGTAPSITYTCTTPSADTGQTLANDTAVLDLANAGANMVYDPTFSAATETGLPSNWEAHATIDDYYQGIAPTGGTPTNLASEVALDNTDPQESEKDGNGTHASEALSDDSTLSNGTPSGGATALGIYNQAAYDAILPYRKVQLQSAINAQLSCPGQAVTLNQNTTINLPLSGTGLGGPTTVSDGYSYCPNGPQNSVIAVIGSTASSSPAAGLPEMVVPFGYSTTQRRNIGVDISGYAYDEYNIIGIGYVLEQASKAREGVGEVDPAAYRCAHTVPAEPFASRGSCNPDYQSVMSILGGQETILPFPLETTSASQLESMLAAGTLTSVQLVKAELTRIALANANGPAIQAIRSLNPDALADAAASDAERATAGPRGPLEGIPVFVDDTINVAGLATSGGSIALQNNIPSGDATLVANLRAAGAIIMGDTNTTELANEFNGDASTNMPAGYSSLGGQVLLANDTNKSPGGSSAGSADAVATGFSPLAVGIETGTDGYQMIIPSANAGVVAIKPTVGTVSTSGIIPDAPSQDSPGAIGQTVTDVATEMNALTGTTGYTADLSNTALGTARLNFVTDTSTTDSYSAAVSAALALGAVGPTVATPTATTQPNIVPYEFHKSLDAYLASTPEASSGGPASLNDVINYYNANPVEGLKFSDAGLTAAEALDYTNPTTQATYQNELSLGQNQDQADISNLLNIGPPQFNALMVPSTSALVGIADRAGYPVVTVPDGFVSQANSAGGDPNGVAFIGRPGSDALLLGYAYALEQSMNARNSGPAYMKSGTVANPTFSGAPSETFQSDWRCVPGSAFFSAYDCNPGDVETPISLSAIPDTYPELSVVGGNVTPTLGLTIASASTSLGTFVPGVANTYQTSVAASVTSTGGDAALTVSDPSTTSPGDLTNGTFALGTPLEVAATNSKTLSPKYAPLSGSPLTLLSYSLPVTSDPVQLDFEQPITATQALRSGTYSKTLLFTLSTDTP